MLPLPPGAQPTGLQEPLEEDEVDEHRYDHCPVYDRCLDWIVERHPGWMSFTCQQCPLWPDEERMDDERI